MTLAQILIESPRIPNRGDVQTAFYSAHCVWWTSFPEDLGSKRVGTHELPCCPHCGSMLFEGSLERFVEYALANPQHYGLLGVDAFVAAHHRNGVRGSTWDQINRQLLGDASATPPGSA